jgi:hypothetical protein
VTGAFTRKYIDFKNYIHCHYLESGNDNYQLKCPGAMAKKNRRISHGVLRGPGGGRFRQELYFFFKVTPP